MLMVLGIILILAALGLVAYQVISGHMAQSRSDKVMDVLSNVVPQYEDGDAEATGRGEDPLPMVEVDGVSFVGYLVIPEQDLKIPVAGQDYEGSGFVFQDSGSPVKGRFVIGGKALKGLFGSIDQIKPGETVTFVDTNGVRYNYTVTGMMSTKKLEGIDHDLILHTGISRGKSLAVFGTME